MMHFDGKKKTTAHPNINICQVAPVFLLHLDLARSYKEIKSNAFMDFLALVYPTTQVVFPKCFYIFYV